MKNHTCKKDKHRLKESFYYGYLDRNRARQDTDASICPTDDNYADYKDNESFSIGLKVAN